MRAVMCPPEVQIAEWLKFCEGFAARMLSTGVVTPAGQPGPKGLGPPANLLLRKDPCMSRLSSPRRNRPQLTVEALEQRDLLTAALSLPLTANLGTLAAPVARNQTLGDTTAGAREV